MDGSLSIFDHVQCVLHPSSFRSLPSLWSSVSTFYPGVQIPSAFWEAWEFLESGCSRSIQSTVEHFREAVGGCLSREVEKKTGPFYTKILFDASKINVPVDL